MLDTDHNLAELPVRLQVLVRPHDLLQREHPADERAQHAAAQPVGTDIAWGGFDLAMSKSTATHHFKVLREAGLIRQYYVGTSRMNALRRDEMDEAFPGLLGALTSAGAEAR